MKQSEIQISFRAAIRKSSSIDFWLSSKLAACYSKNPRTRWQTASSRAIRDRHDSSHVFFAIVAVDGLTSLPQPFHDLDTFLWLKLTRLLKSAFKCFDAFELDIQRRIAFRNDDEFQVKNCFKAGANSLGL